MSSSQSSHDRIKQAVETFVRKDAKKYQPKKKRNDKPEEKVVDAHIDFFSKNDWFINRYESKAVRHSSGIYRQTSVLVGHPDLGGCTPTGVAAWIETKAHGRRSSVRHAQRVFLVDAIQRGAFAIVSDSLSYTLRVYHEWILLPHDARVALLQRELPQLPAQPFEVGVCPF